MKFLLSLSMLLLALTPLACGEEHDHDHDHDMSMTGEDCEVYTANMEKMGMMGQVKVRLTTANPAPPDRGNNTWQLEILNAADDTPITDATVVLEPAMPAHGHGTSPATFDATHSADGVYDVGPMDLFMPGRWAIDVDITLPDSTTDMAQFAFCLEG